MKNNKQSGKPEESPRRSGAITFFSSLSLTIALLILLAVLSIVGTIIPQNTSPSQALQQYGPGLYAVFERLGFFDIYHSIWFVSLLGLLSMNLLVCSARNLPRTLRIISRTKTVLDSEGINSMPYTGSVRLALSRDEARDRLRPILKKYCAEPIETGASDALYFFSQKGKYSRLGVYVTHLSVILILLGGLIGSLFGFRGTINLVEGEKSGHVFIGGNGVAARELGFEIRCDDFEVTYYSSGMPRDYKSRLTVIDQGKEVLSRTIEVNHPLRYKGLSFYQASYGTASTAGDIVITAQKNDQGSPVESFTVPAGGSFTLPDTGLSVQVVRLFNDFVMDSQGQPVDQSTEPHNPAAELLVSRDGKALYRTWVFQNFPDFHGRRGDYTFVLQGIKGKEYTGLQVTSDPGEKLVWIGCCLMILGIMGTFFFSHQQIWARISPGKGKQEIVLAGSANKNRLVFEQNFRRMEKEIAEAAAQQRGGATPGSKGAE